MKILYLSQRFPFPPDRGDRITVYNHIRRLSQSRQVYSASLAELKSDLPKIPQFKSESVEPVAAGHTRANSYAGMVRAFLTGKPLTLGFYYNRKLALTVRRLYETAPPDVAIAFSSSMAQYLEPYPETPRIIHFCDLDSQKWADLAEQSAGLKKLIYRREAKLLLRYEREIAARFSASCVVTQREADLFNRLVPGVAVHVIENGVDYEYWQGVKRNPTAGLISFVGVMDYPPNVEAVVFFARNILPRIREKAPDATFVIVGSRPSQEVLRLQSLPGVSATGFVQDVRPYLAQSSLVTAPLAVARGIQNKVLEAMAAGAPVLATPQAAAGLPPEGRQRIDVAPRDAESFAAAATRILSDPAAAEAKARKAAGYIKDSYCWKEKVRPLEELIDAVVGEKLLRRPACNE